MGHWRRSRGRSLSACQHIRDVSNGKLVAITVRCLHVWPPIRHTGQRPGWARCARGVVGKRRQDNATVGITAEATHFKVATLCGCRSNKPPARQSDNGGVRQTGIYSGTHTASVSATAAANLCQFRRTGTPL